MRIESGARCAAGFRSGLYRLIYVADTVTCRSRKSPPVRIRARSSSCATLALLQTDSEPDPPCCRSASTSGMSAANLPVKGRENNNKVEGVPYWKLNNIRHLLRTRNGYNADFMRNQLSH